MALSNINDTKNIEDVLFEYIIETNYESKVEKPPCHNEARNIKYLQ